MSGSTRATCTSPARSGPLWIKLLEKGACYKAEDGAIMYRSAQYAAKYGVVKARRTTTAAKRRPRTRFCVRANGIPTYFAADIAYHYNKLAVRGFDKAIDVWGADHHGHVARMKGAMDAIGLDGNSLDIVLMQMVNLMRDGKPVRMSKRTGKAITLTDLLDEVPIDSARASSSTSAKAPPRWTLTWTWPCATTAKTRSTMSSTPTRASARC